MLAAPAHNVEQVARPEIQREKSAVCFFVQTVISERNNDFVLGNFKYAKSEGSVEGESAPVYLKHFSSLIAITFWGKSEWSTSECFEKANTKKSEVPLGDNDRSKLQKLSFEVDPYGTKQIRVQNRVHWTFTYGEMLHLNLVPLPKVGKKFPRMRKQSPMPRMKNSAMKNFPMTEINIFEWTIISSHLFNIKERSQPSTLRQSSSRNFEPVLTSLKDDARFFKPLAD